MPSSFGVTILQIFTVVALYWVQGTLIGSQFACTIPSGKTNKDRRGNTNL